MSETENYPQFQAVNVIPPCHYSYYETGRVPLALLRVSASRPEDKDAKYPLPTNKDKDSQPPDSCLYRSMSHGVNGSCSCLVLLYFSHATELAQMQHYSTSCAEAETDRICPSQTPLPSAHPPKAPCPLTSSLWGTTAQSEKLNANLSSRVHQKSIKSVRKQYPLTERRCR